MPINVRVYLLAALVRDVKLLARIIDTGLPRWRPYLSPGEVAAVLALRVALQAVIDEFPLPD